MYTWIRSGVAVAMAQAGSCNFDSTPSLGTSTCCGCSLKKKKEKKKKNIDLQNNNKNAHAFKLECPLLEISINDGVGVSCTTTWMLEHRRAHLCPRREGDPTGHLSPLPAGPHGWLWLLGGTDRRLQGRKRGDGDGGRYFFPALSISDAVFLQIHRWPFPFPPAFLRLQGYQFPLQAQGW